MTALRTLKWAVAVLFSANIGKQWMLHFEETNTQKFSKLKDKLIA